MTNKDKNKIIDYWSKSAEKSWKTAKSLFRLGHYDMSLFCCHLTLEKYLKALILSRKKVDPPFIHDLNRLALIADIGNNEEYTKWFNEITKFNIQARYDDIKLSFYKKATKKFTADYINKTHLLLIWLKEKFPE